MCRHFSVICLLISACAVVFGQERIATIDIARVLNESHLVHSQPEATQLRQAIETVNAQIKSFDSELNRLRSELELYDEQDDKHTELDNAIKVKSMELRLYSQRQQERLGQLETALFRDGFMRGRQMLADFAQARDITLVLLLSPRDPTSGGMREFSAELATHVVLYARPGLDITEDFIAHVNQALPMPGTELAPQAQERQQPAPESAPSIELDAP